MAEWKYPIELYRVLVEWNCISRVEVDYIYSFRMWLLQATIEKSFNYHPSTFCLWV